MAELSSCLGRLRTHVSTLSWPAEEEQKTQFLEGVGKVIAEIGQQEEQPPESIHDQENEAEQMQRVLEELTQHLERMEREEEEEEEEKDTEK